jgi:hypothetical protein
MPVANTGNRRKRGLPAGGDRCRPAATPMPGNAPRMDFGPQRAETRNATPMKSAAVGSVLFPGLSERHPRPGPSSSRGRAFA